jgi:DNA-binding LacI/PurR family transcriptional regulator
VSDLIEKLAKLGVQLLVIPPPTGEELHRLQGWRDGIEEHGQELWRIYHWIVDAQDGSTHGVYRLRDWLETYNVPDETGGEHWKDAR